MPSHDAKPARRRSSRGRAVRFWLAQRLLLPLLELPIKLLVRTWRIEIEPPDEFSRLCRGEGRPVALAVLHGSALVLVGAAWRSRAQGGLRTTTIVSPSRDGRLLADLIERFGQKTVAGSSSKRGAEGLLALIDATRAGSIGTISVDGPRGPRAHPRRGIFALAKASRARLLVACAAARPALRVPSWDRQMVPAPFARVRLRFVEMHDYAQGDFPGDEHAALHALFVENLKKDGEPVDDIVPLPGKAPEC